MLTDKDMAGDCLEAKKHGCVELTKMAMECSNQQLRQALIQMRNECETAQQQIAQMSSTKGWYLPASQADQNDIQKVANFYQPATREMAGITR